MSPLQITRIRVSTVLNDDTKTYGKQFLLDDRDDTCWNSAAGDEQFILLQLAQATQPKRLEMMFQGGFVARQCDICTKKDDGSWTPVQTIYPADINALQSFDLVDLPAAQDWTIYLRQPTDFYGRITLYRFALYE